MRILFVHLLNDYSGSPRVLRSLASFMGESSELYIFTSNEAKGFLSNLDNVNYVNVPYYFSKNKLLRLCLYLISQFFLFLKILKYSDESSVVYVNTILPFGAALAAKVKGAKVIYHFHETSIRPKLLMKFLTFIAYYTSEINIFVSKYLKKQFDQFKNCHICYNFCDSKYEPNVVNPNPRKILLIASAKEYKGIFLFSMLAEKCPEYEFTLVLNTDSLNVKKIFPIVPKNLEVHPACVDTGIYYRQSDLLLNLSIPELWVETFGLTILEAFHHSIPCIAPNIGGPTELIDDGVNGFLVDPKNIQIIKEKINYLFTNSHVYESFCKKALEKSASFNKELILNNWKAIISNEV